MSVSVGIKLEIRVLLSHQRENLLNIGKLPKPIPLTGILIRPITWSQNLKVNSSLAQDARRLAPANRLLLQRPSHMELVRMMTMAK